MQSRPHATDEQRRLLDSLRWDLRFQLCGDYEYCTIIRKPVSIYAQLMSQATLWEFQVLIDYQNKRTILGAFLRGITLAEREIMRSKYS